VFLHSDGGVQKYLVSGDLRIRVALNRASQKKAETISPNFKIEAERHVSPMSTPK
jgi:hypothetical protein